MRGADTFTESLFTMRRLEDFVPDNHPLRPRLWHIHWSATARVAIYPWCTTVNDRETSETPDLNAVPTHQCAIHRIQDRRNGEFSIPVCQLTEPVGETLNEV